MIAKQDQVHWQHPEQWPEELTPAQREQLLQAKLTRAAEWIRARAGLDTFKHQNEST